MKMQYYQFCYNKRLTALALSVVSLISLLFVQYSAAQPARTTAVAPETAQAGLPGSLDSTFGNDGILITDFRRGGRAMVTQSDGKIVVAGYSGSDFALARYNPNGSLDTSFGDGGKVITSMGSGYDAVNSLAIQSDGKIVAAGVGNADGSYSYFAVARYNSNGSLDNTFDFDGKVLTRVGTGGDNIGREDVAYSVAIQSDGKIVAAGKTGYDGSDGALTRYNTNGSLDTSFGGDGIITTLTNSSIHSLAIQTDGKIVAAVGDGSFVIIGGYSYRLARFNTDGSLDTSFNGNGIVTTNFGGNSALAKSVAIQPNGKIVAAGYSSSNGNNDFALTRYNTNGSLDTSFAGDGKVTTPISSGSDDKANSVAIQPDGKIVAAGQRGNGLNSNFAIARYNANGSLDVLFDSDGIVTTSMGSGGSSATAVALQPDGKIVAAGDSSDDFAIVRYHASRAKTLFDFDGDGKADISVFRPSDSVWYLNRSTQGFSAAQFGLSTDKLMPADYDGDGKTDIAVFRNGMWYWLNSSNGSFYAFQTVLGNPYAADFDGDGRAELAICNGTSWAQYNLATNTILLADLFDSCDKYLVGDYNGDGRADAAVYRGGVWYFNSQQIQFGLPTDKPVPADYDGDGKTDIAVYRDGIWYVLQSSQGFTAYQWGISTDVPAPADYDGDGRADPAVYRDGLWCLLQSTNGILIQQFGLPNDKPVTAAYLSNYSMAIP